MLLVSSALAGPLLRDQAPPLPPALPSVEAELHVSATEVTGRATLGWTNTTSAPVAELPILVHANDGAVPTTSLGGVEVTAGGPATVDATPDIVLVRFETPLAPGARAEVRLSWTSTVQALPPDVNDLVAQGLDQLGALTGGGGDYGLLATGDGLTVVASAVPLVSPFVAGAPAVHVKRPGNAIGDLAWGGPAAWKVHVVLPEGWKAVTNLADRTQKDGSVLAEGTGPSDLVVVASPDLVIAQASVGAVTVRSASLARDAGAAREVLAAGTRALRALQRYGPYPYAELDLVEASLKGGAGGVEFGGMALVAGVLYRDPSSSTNPLGTLLQGLGGPGIGQVIDLSELRSFTVAHEVAHQWCPELVVADAWSDPVVDEPLAQYLGWRVLAEGLPDAEAQALADREIRAAYGTMRMLGHGDGPAARATSAFTDGLEYAGLVYGKAPGLYLALEQSLGRDELDAALRAAVADRAWATTDADTWLAALERHGATGAVALGARWWREAHGDEDLGLDPEGWKAMRMMLGPSAGAVEPLLHQLGTTPSAWFSAFAGRR